MSHSSVVQPQTKSHTLMWFKLKPTYVLPPIKNKINRLLETNFFLGETFWTFSWNCPVKLCYRPFKYNLKFHDFNPWFQFQIFKPNLGFPTALLHRVRYTGYYGYVYGYFHRCNIMHHLVFLFEIGHFGPKLLASVTKVMSSTWPKM